MSADGHASKTKIKCAIDFNSLFLHPVKDSGMEVNEVDKEAFKEAVAPVYDKYSDKYGDLFKKIEAAKEEK